MGRRFWGMVLGLSLGASLAWAAPPGCDEQVAAQYQGLVQDQLLPAVAGWSQQLTTLTEQIRTQRTEYDIKEQQAKLAERTIAQLLNQIRQLRLQQQALQAEVERLQGAPPPPN